MPLKTCAGRHFLYGLSHQIFFFLDSTVWGELTCRATSGAGCVCTNFSPPAPPSADSHDCSDESRIPLLLNSSKHHFQTPLAGRGWECGGRKREEEGGLDLQQRQMQRGQNVFFDHTPAQTGQKDFFSGKTWQWVNSAHTVSQNTALCKSSKNAFTFHSCSYFRRA